MFKPIVTFAGLLLFKFPESSIKRGKIEGKRNSSYFMKLLRSNATGIQHVAVISLLGELVNSLVGGKKKKSLKC